MCVVSVLQQTRKLEFTAYSDLDGAKKWRVHNRPLCVCAVIDLLVMGMMGHPPTRRLRLGPIQVEGKPREKNRTTRCFK